MEQVDFLGLDEQLTERERERRREVRSFVDEEVTPVIADYYERGAFPRQFVGRMAELGLIGMKLPDFGDAGSVEYGLTCQELERGDTALRSYLSVVSSLVMEPIARFGTPEQRKRWLAPLARGEAIGAFGLTEPAAGSDPAHMKTTAVREGDGWVINGVKRWISFGSIADVVLVWARTDEGMRGFLVEKGLPGFSARDIERLLSYRASLTSTLVFEDVRVSEADRLPGAEGLKAPLSILNGGRLGIAWGAMGAAIDCYQRARDYATKRVQFERPIASFQLIQQKLVKMLTEICKGQMLALQVSRLAEDEKATPAQISMAKMNNVAEALKIAREARSVLGGNGVSGDFHVMRHMCNLESVYTYEGTNEVHTLLIGAAITGHQAFK
ncbi:MAG: acyl-CoA dehydrogenase [Desulfuromonadales bacterium]|nr:acyl-CoA dehydrogenase [Desulfuromonadales bacterium]NIR34298.1 acyl-CoA dehydrogenase [Desulfuromonadales bacterium]NIS41742.1 acyl-CoA dehydrogenase [Desulfuromonadales bacterium]